MKNDGSEYIWSGEQKYLTVQLLHLSFFQQLMKLSCFDKEGKSAFILLEAFIRQEGSFATVICQIYSETSLDWEQKHQGTFSKNLCQKKSFFLTHISSVCDMLQKKEKCLLQNREANTLSDSSISAVGTRNYPDSVGFTFLSQSKTDLGVHNFEYGFGPSQWRETTPNYLEEISWVKNCASDTTLDKLPPSYLLSAWC